MTEKGGKPHDQFDLQPHEHEPELEVPHEPEAEPGADIAIQPAEESAVEAPLDGPPPSNKVDFENLPEFVWQRKMLRTVRNWALVASAVILVIVLLFVFVFGKKTQELLKPATDPLPKDAFNPSGN